MAKRFKIYLVGNGTCYHTLDWCKSIQKRLPVGSWVFVTDMIGGGDQNRLFGTPDNIEQLFNIDRFLFFKATVRGDQWRNFLKLLLAPIQAIILKKKINGQNGIVIHAHTFYYGLLCRLAGHRFFFTPQGFELTERPYNSKFYAFLMSWVLKGAEHVIVDSSRMLNSCVGLGCDRVSLYQYGIDSKRCLKFNKNQKRKDVVSNRGMNSNYRLNKILLARNSFETKLPITFVYPFFDKKYLSEVRSSLGNGDHDLGLVSKDSCFELYAKARLVISIPSSDSSPRSVYEAIFCGAPVATVFSKWVDNLPTSMRERVILVDLDNKDWLLDALKFADQLMCKKFQPCDSALENFDQFNVTSRIFETFYRPVLELKS